MHFKWNFAFFAFIVFDQNGKITFYIDVGRGCCHCIHLLNESRLMKMCVCVWNNNENMCRKRRRYDKRSRNEWKAINCIFHTQNMRFQCNRLLRTMKRKRKKADKKRQQESIAFIQKLCAVGRLSMRFNFDWMKTNRSTMTKLEFESIYEYMLPLCVRAYVCVCPIQHLLSSELYNTPPRLGRHFNMCAVSSFKNHSILFFVYAYGPSSLFSRFQSIIVRRLFSCPRRILFSLSHSLSCVHSRDEESKEKTNTIW